jgi:presequence protease
VSSQSINHTDVRCLWSGATILRHELPTNGIAYVDVGFDVSGLSLDDLPLLPLFLRTMLETGTSKLDQTQLIRQIGTHTGGLSTTSRINFKYPKGGVVSTATDLVSHVFLRGKATTSKAPELFDLMLQVLTDANLDNQKRVLEMLRESKARYRSSVVGAGHSFASTRLSSRYSLPGLISERDAGITYMQSLDKMIETAEKDWPAFRARLERIRDVIIKKEGLILNLTGDRRVLSGILVSSLRLPPS